MFEIHALMKKSNNENLSVGFYTIEYNVMTYSMSE